MAAGSSLVYSERPWSSRARGIIALVVLVPFAVLAIVSAPWLQHGALAGLPFFALGWVLFLAGAAFRFWATLYIGGHKGSRLETSGPYSVCRNPLYLGSFLMTLAIAGFVPSLTFGIGLMLATAAYYSVTVPEEERRLRLRYGHEYEAYCHETPRFWPRWGNFHTQERVEIDVRCLAIEGRRALRWVWIPLACEVFAHFRAESWWPHLLWLP